ncbi:hypothetical protein, partial [Pseudomonas sp. FW306-2-11BA]|uniref:hypothetical protein n=1 Tax=Pseudomonas sp. FW306-2-11BA TaxID=2070662 RepID=UPI001C480984
VLVVGPEGAGTDRTAGGASRFEALVEGLRARLPGALYELLELAYNLPAGLRLSRAVARFRPDVIYERHNLFLLAGLVTAWRAGRPLLLEVNA